MTVNFQHIYNAIALLSTAKEDKTKKSAVKWIIRMAHLQALCKFREAENNKILTLDVSDCINRSCQLAAIIFWVTVDEKGCSSGHEQTQTSPLNLDRLLEELEIAVAGVRVSSWLRLAPAVYTWVCLTGAAAAQDIHRRAWFYFQQSHRALMSSEDWLLQDSWLYFRWPRELSRNTN
jgi:hypothetical protein